MYPKGLSIRTDVAQSVECLLSEVPALTEVEAEGSELCGHFSYPVQGCLSIVSKREVYTNLDGLLSRIYEELFVKVGEMD